MRQGQDIQGAKRRQAGHAAGMSEPFEAELRSHQLLTAKTEVENFSSDTQIIVFSLKCKMM